MIESSPAVMSAPERRRLLFVTPFAPRLDGVDGGSRVMAQLIERLAEHHEIAVIYLRSRGGPDLGPLAEKCDLAVEVNRPWASRGPGLLTRRARLTLGLARGIPLWAGRWSVAGFSERLRHVVEEWRPDVIQFEYHVMGQYAPAVRSYPAARVLVQHEPGIIAARDRLATIDGMKRLVAAADLLAWRRYERRIMGEVDRVVVFTERDRETLLPFASGTPVVRIPLGTAIPPRPLDPTGREPMILFIGNFIHPPNVDAAGRLVRSIFPMIRLQHPEATLTIVGDNAPAWIRTPADPGITVTGRVPDISPYLERAAVVAVPLRKGGGMRVKMLEALAAGKAVVCTRLAAEGLGVKDGEHVRLAETDEEAAAAVAELLASVDLRRSLGEQARKWAYRNAGWDRAVAAYAALYKELTSDVHGAAVLGGEG